MRESLLSKYSIKILNQSNWIIHKYLYFKNQFINCLIYVGFVCIYLPMCLSNHDFLCSVRPRLPYIFSIPVIANSIYYPDTYLFFCWRIKCESELNVREERYEVTRVQSIFYDIICYNIHERTYVNKNSLGPCQPVANLFVYDRTLYDFKILYIDTTWYMILLWNNITNSTWYTRICEYID